MKSYDQGLDASDAESSKGIIRTNLSGICSISMTYSYQQKLRSGIFGLVFDAEFTVNRNMICVFGGNHKRDGFSFFQTIGKLRLCLPNPRAVVSNLMCSLRGAIGNKPSTIQ